MNPCFRLIFYTVEKYRNHNNRKGTLLLANRQIEKDPPLPLQNHNQPNPSKKNSSEHNKAIEHKYSNDNSNEIFSRLISRHKMFYQHYKCWDKHTRIIRVSFYYHSFHHTYLNVIKINT